jgi:hypothetical protein
MSVSVRTRGTDDFPSVPLVTKVFNLRYLYTA